LPIPTEFERLRVVLVAPRNPLNIGAAARAMSNFGFSSLRVVNPYQIAFQEATSAVGADHVLKHATEYPTVADAVADCRLVVGTTAVGPRHLNHPLKRLEEGARVIRRGLGPGNVALLFGSEKRGLSNRDFSYCHWLMRIPTREEHRSMNLGQAVAVCLYEVIRESRVKRQAEKLDLVTAGEMERITTLLLDVLQVSGYLDLRRIASSEEKIRRLVKRMKLPAADAESWLGMLRQILWKLRAGREVAN
jgi:TrmH family RNA methyltransferase